MISGLFALFLSFQIPLEPVDPNLVWQTKHTQHFRIHYPSELEQVADRLAVVAEPIHAELSSSMSWTPAAPVHVVLLNNTDVANGFSTPIPYNAIYLNIAPPPAASSLDHYDEWLTILFTHEYTHSLHVDMVHGVNKFLRFFMGRAIVPNAAQPQWLLEGYAVYHESFYTSGGRGDSTLVNMHLRQAALDDSWLPISRATYWNDIYPFGQAAYWYGVGFYQFIAERYGADKWAEFAHTNANWIIPGWFNFKTRRIFGKSFSRLWDEWAEHETKHWQTEVERYQPQMQSAPLVSEGIRLAGSPCWAPTTDKLYASVVDERDRVQLAVFEWKEKSSAPEMQILEKSFAAADLHCTENALYFSKLSRTTPYNLFSDIYRYDLKGKFTTQLTQNARLSSPSLIGDRVFAVQTAALKSKILSFRLPEVFLNAEEEPKKKFKASKHAYDFQLVKDIDGFSTISALEVSPDQKRLLFSMFRENARRDLYLVDVKSSKLTQITQSDELKYFPQWAGNNEIIYVSDRPLPGTSTKVFNVYKKNLDSNLEESLTDTWSGIYWPRLKANRLVFGHFKTKGFELEVSELQSIRETKALASSTFEARIPSILRQSQPLASEVKTRDYQIGSSLLPHYLIPFGYYTEDDSLLGAFVGSNDPLGFHRWIGLGYYVVAPKRPGGTLLYSYLGFGDFAVNVSASAGISNFGRVFVFEDQGDLFFMNDDYYERSYRASLGVSYQLWANSKPLPFFLSHDISFSDRRSLLKIPSQAIRNPIPLEGGGSLRTFPDQGQQVGFSSAAIWGGNFSRELTGIAPASGTSVRLELEYSPKLPGMDFHTLTTSLSYRQYFEFLRFHSIAFLNVIGIQWLDQLYQSTFRLGGSLGETPLNSFNRKNIPLRGLPSTALRGEGVSAASLEYRFPLLRQVPGWGTAPIWFKNFSGVFFNDIGQAFQLKDEPTALDANPQNFNFRRFTWSTGGELRSEVSVYYGPPITFRLGYGHVLYLEGQRVRGRRLDELYFQVGSSF